MVAESSTAPRPSSDVAEKGLKGGALGLISSVVIGVASTAPAYSLAATLGFIVAFIGVQTPAVVVLAFVPMLFVAIGYSELNKIDPDCGTTFTWASRAFGKKIGWLGGWGIIAADVLVMASLAQVAGQYGFLLFNADGIGHNSTSGWVLLVGILWIAVMTYICYRGIEVSANFQKALLGVEITMLFVFSIVALVKVGTGHAPDGHLTPKLAWFNPLDIPSFSTFTAGLILMLFIYWGWDTTVAINEETADRNRTPGRAAILSTVLLLITYVIVTLAAQSFAGVGDSGIGLGNAENQGDVLSVLGHAVFGSTGVGPVFTHLLILMVLTSAAASTQTTILPTARTTLSMAVYQAIPRTFAKIHRRHLTPSVSTIAMGVISAILYVALYKLSGGNVISDSVTALGLAIAFYYGLTGFACTWTFRKTLTQSARNLWMQGILPTLGGLILFFAMGWSAWLDWETTNETAASYTSWLLPFSPHWRIGGAFLIGCLAAIAGLVLMFVYAAVRPTFFRNRELQPFNNELAEHLVD
jgi:amino acid transporter